MAPDSRLRDVFRTAYKSGYHLRAFPPELGGPGFGPMDAWVVGEEMGWGNAGLSISLGVTSMPFRFAAMTGNPDLMREIVMPYVEDTEGKYIGCWCATEPNHGSDAILYSGEHSRADIHFECMARRDGDEWVINGQKSAWVSNGTIATHTLAFLCVDPAMGMAGTGVAVIPLNLPGITRGKPLDKLGQRALNQGEIFFEDVRIPRHYMLVEPSAFGGATDNVLAQANAGMSTTFCGVARAAYEEAIAYAQQRIQGGVAIVSPPTRAAPAVRHVHPARIRPLVVPPRQPPPADWPAHDPLLDRRENVLHPDRLRPRVRRDPDLRRHRPRKGHARRNALPRRPRLAHRRRRQRRPRPRRLPLPIAGLR